MLLASAIETSCSCKSISIFLRRQECLPFLNSVLSLLFVRLKIPEADNKPYLRLMCIETAFEFHITYEAGSEVLILPKQMYFRWHSLPFVRYCITQRGRFHLEKAAMTLLWRYYDDHKAIETSRWVCEERLVCVRGRYRVTGALCLSNYKQFECFLMIRKR